MKFKSLIKLVIAFQIAFMPLTKAEDGLDFDFSDEPVYINSGEDDVVGGQDGNCTGAGCGEDGRGGGRENREGSEDGQRDDPREDRSHYDESRFLGEHPSLGKALVEPSKIVTFDQDRGDGLIFVRDEHGKIYYRGEPSQLLHDEQGEYYSVDHSDIYYGKEGGQFVKSADGRKLIDLNKLFDCAPYGTCEEIGFKSDWWNYSTDPDLKNSDHAEYWYFLVEFSKNQLSIKNQLTHAAADPLISKDVGKVKVLGEAKALLQDAAYAYGIDQYDEARAFQLGAETLLATLVDVGLSVSPLGWAKDAFEFISGQSLVDGHRLSKQERLIAGIGVAMPGVAGLAFAGMRIISRNPLTREGAIIALHQAEKVTQILGDLKAVRFKPGENLGVVAVIGRDMNYVREASARLNAAGISTRVFEMSKVAKQDFLVRTARQIDTFMPNEKLPDTLVYQENMDWIKQIESEKIGVIDVGNPGLKSTRSRFYDDEVAHIFGVVEQ